MELAIITEKGFVEGIEESATGAQCSWRHVELQDVALVRFVFIFDNLFMKVLDEKLLFASIFPIFGNLPCLALEAVDILVVATHP